MCVLRLSFRLPLYYELKTLLLLGIAFILYSVSIIGTTPIVEEGCQFALLYRSALFPVRRARRSFRDQVTLPISFDCRVSNLVLYYCIVIVSPFVNQNQLSSMREYTGRPPPPWMMRWRPIQFRPTSPSLARNSTPPFLAACSLFVNKHPHTTNSTITGSCRPGSSSASRSSQHNRSPAAHRPPSSPPPDSLSPRAPSRFRRG